MLLTASTISVNLGYIRKICESEISTFLIAFSLRALVSWNSRSCSLLFCGVRGTFSIVLWASTSSRLSNVVNSADL